MALSVGHPRATHSRYVIGCCLIPLAICGVKNNSRRITYAIGCVWGMPSLSPLSALDSFQYIWGGLIFGEGMVKSDIFLCLPVDGTITGGVAYEWQFMV